MKENDEHVFKLTDKQKLVCDIRLKNPTWTNGKCYMAVYPNCGHKAAMSSASRLFSDEEVKRYLDHRKDEIVQQVNVDVQYVLRGLMNIVEFNPQDMLDENGAPKQLKDLDPDVAKCLDAVKGYKIIEQENEDGKKILVPVITKYRIGDKKGALELLGKYLKMWTDKVELDDINIVNRKFNLIFKEPESRHKD